MVHTEHGIGRYEGRPSLTALAVTMIVFLFTLAAINYICRWKIWGCCRDMVAPVARPGGNSVVLHGRRVLPASKPHSGYGRTAYQDCGGALWFARQPLIAEEGSFAVTALVLPLPKPDRLNAINDVVDDLASGKASDRLICGDVGFGKTEVALRAAFIAAMAGYQVVLVAPTTLWHASMARFFRRFAGFN